MKQFLLRHGCIIAFTTCFASGLFVGSFYEGMRTLSVTEECKEKIEKANKIISFLHENYTHSHRELRKSKELLIEKEIEIQKLKYKELEKRKNST